MKYLIIISIFILVSCSNKNSIKKNYNEKIKICEYNDYPINIFLIEENIKDYEKDYKKELASEDKNVISKIGDLTSNKDLNILHFLAVGDIIPHGMVKKTALLGKKGVEDFDFIFSEIKDDIKKADLAFANFETPYYPTTKENAYKSIPFKFNIPIKMIKTLKDIGFDIFNLANNHMYDQGIKGITTTLKGLTKEGFLISGIGRNYKEAIKPIITTRKGIKIGIISFTTWINNDKNRYIPTHPDKKLKNRAHINMYFPKEAKKLVKKLRKKVDFLIVSMHWGHEYHKDESYEQKRKTKLLFKAGADLILGHHPHVLQRTVSNKNKTVIYSMGNFVSNQFFIIRSRHKRNKFANREGVLWNIDITKKKDKTIITKLKPTPLYLSKIEKNPKKKNENNYRIFLHKLNPKKKLYKSIYKFIKPTKK